MSKSPQAFADPLGASGVAGAAALFAQGRITPVDVVETYLSRIERFNPSLNAFLFVDRDGALQDAKASATRWAAGRPLSVVDGVPLGIKANIAVQGTPWHAGIAAYKDRVAREDADSVAALRKAGAVILGILNMDEAALGAVTNNPTFGQCRNPYGRELTAGGSSGGSGAAVAARLCAAALGTDTMGSVRIPASYCGVFGHMARRESISLAGVVPLSWSLDCIGVLARSADDAAAVLSILNDDQAMVDRGSSHVSPTIAAIDLSAVVEFDADVAHRFEGVIEKARSLGLTVKSIGLPSYDVVAMRRLCLLIAEVEAFVEHEAALSARPKGFSPALSGMLTWAAGQSAPKMAEAYRSLARAAAAIGRDLAAFDAILTPTTSTPAFPLHAPAAAGQADFTLIANIVGLAATAFPTGLGREGLPRSAQLLGRNDRAILALAGRLATPSPPPERLALEAA